MLEHKTKTISGSLKLEISTKACASKGQLTMRRERYLQIEDNAYNMRTMQPTVSEKRRKGKTYTDTNLVVVIDRSDFSTIACRGSVPSRVPA